MDYCITANIIFAAFLILSQMDFTSGTLSKSDKKVAKSGSKGTSEKLHKDSSQGPNMKTVYDKGMHRLQMQNRHP